MRVLLFVFKGPVPYAELYSTYAHTSREGLDGRRQLGQDGADVLGQAAAGASTLSRDKHHLHRGGVGGWMGGGVTAECGGKQFAVWGSLREM